MLSDPKECKKRALLWRAQTSQSPEVRRKFADLAQTWLLFAVQLEAQRALIDHWGPPKRTGRPQEREDTIDRWQPIRPSSVPASKRVIDPAR